MKSVLQQGRIPKNLHVDQGKEFYNNEFKDLMKQHKINLYSTFSNLKAPISRGGYKWTDILEDLVNTYNNTKHRTIKMKPADVTAAQEKQLLEKSINLCKLNHNRRKINSKLNTSPTTCKLVDYQDQPIQGGFYEEELSKVKYPEVYLVEKIIQKRGNKYYVKWLGFDTKHNSWINKTDI
ncbi:uncharacterized protein LOC123274170 [Cotesia glomerata]|uniref:uncharacterized protein LOC123274170 n=1 Tax=Cotesia glomerata TaxID=32391 RepID=UPI001D02C872|nr:uncharacterized protein LOC123274170 [Cotesia glomerata]